MFAKEDAMTVAGLLFMDDTDLFAFAKMITSHPNDVVADLQLCSPGKQASTPQEALSNLKNVLEVYSRTGFPKERFTSIRPTRTRVKFYFSPRMVQQQSNGWQHLRASQLLALCKR